MWLIARGQRWTPPRGSLSAAPVATCCGLTAGRSGGMQPLLLTTALVTSGQFSIADLIADGLQSQLQSVRRRFTNFSTPKSTRSAPGYSCLKSAVVSTCGHLSTLSSVTAADVTDVIGRLPDKQCSSDLLPTCMGVRAVRRCAGAVPCLSVLSVVYHRLHAGE